MYSNAWRVSMTGVDTQGYPTADFTERWEAIEEFIGRLECIDVIFFGAYVTCECGDDLCAPCALQAHADAYRRDEMYPDGPLAFFDIDTGITVTVERVPAYADV